MKWTWQYVFLIFSRVEYFKLFVIKFLFSIKKQNNKLVNEESFVGKKYNFSSARSLDLAIEMIIADIPSPYYNVLEPVLNTLVKNELEENITLNDGSIFHSGETLPWITLKQKEQ